jgi:tRNA dimethylallyltransferase
LDPVYYAKVDLQNPQRLIRALEICLGTGRSFSSFLVPQKNKRSFNSIVIGFTASRDIIYKRINARVDKMISAGLLSEAESLLAHKSLNALQTVGYKEIFQYLDKTLDWEVAVEEIKKNTRRFAKRQLTWFKKDQNCIWFDYDTPLTDIIDVIDSNLIAEN